MPAHRLEENAIHESTTLDEILSKTQLSILVNLADLVVRGEMRLEEALSTLPVR